jgi:hypothetical protein
MQHGRVRLLSNKPKVFPELSFLLCGTTNLRWETSLHNEPGSSNFYILLTLSPHGLLLYMSIMLEGGHFL